MGQTVPGGYYRTADGKIRNANGEVIEEMSDKAREKATEKAPEPEGYSATDPGPLGPVVMPAGDDATKNVEKSAEKPGVPGGKSSGKK